MPSDYHFDKPSLEDYPGWYGDRFQDELDSGRAEDWHQLVTEVGAPRMQSSEFWKGLQANLSEWDMDYQATHDGYPLFGIIQLPDRIETKSFESCVNKAYRWNVLENENWSGPPRRLPSSAPSEEYTDSSDSRNWYGPNNWVTDFPDIFRVRIVATFFDGVHFLSSKIADLAEETTPRSSEVRFRAAQDGYHAAHVSVYHDLRLPEYEDGEVLNKRVKLEIQVTTAIQATISDVLHRVYEEWRLSGPPENWEWDYRDPAFSVNYLGSTLHYLEGMIVLARGQWRTRI